MRNEELVIGYWLLVIGYRLNLFSSFLTPNSSEGVLWTNFSFFSLRLCEILFRVKGIKKQYTVLKFNSNMCEVSHSSFFMKALSFSQHMGL
jgi:hypothetical protein